MPKAKLYWDTVTYGKHIKATQRNWNRSIAAALSSEPGSHAQYNPHIGRDAIRRIEMGCAKCELGEFLGEYSQSFRFLYSHGQDIGVSKGEKTEHILVIVNKSTGSVHGYPIPKADFDKKRQNAQPRNCQP